MSSAICLRSRILLHFFGADSVCQVSHTSSQGSAVFVSVARLGPLVERGLFWLGRLYPLASLLPPPWREPRLVPHLRPASLSHCWDLNICCFSWLQMAHPLGGGFHVLFFSSLVPSVFDFLRNSAVHHLNILKEPSSRLWGVGLPVLWPWTHVSPLLWLRHSI